MSVLKFPKSFSKSSCAKPKKFWWSKQESKRSTQWVNWERTGHVLKQVDRRIGFREFEYQNLARLIKQAGRMANSLVVIWVKVLKGIYFQSWIECSYSNCNCSYHYQPLDCIKIRSNI